MKVVAFTGLHGTGKSFIAKLLAEKLGALYINKRELLKEIYSGINADQADWESWYRDLYKSQGGFKVMEMICSFVENTYKQSNIIIFDAVHNPGELAYLRQKYAAMLILVVTPAQERADRISKRDGAPKDDSIRIKAMHEFDEKGIKSCLYAQADWSMCNYGSRAFLNAQFEALVNYIEESLQI